jgi:hypothetical protein
LGRDLGRDIDGVRGQPGPDVLLRRPAPLLDNLRRRTGQQETLIHQDPGGDRRVTTLHLIDLLVDPADQPGGGRKAQPPKLVFTCGNSLTLNVFDGANGALRHS